MTISATLEIPDEPDVQPPVENEKPSVENEERSFEEDESPFEDEEPSPEDEELVVLFRNEDEIKHAFRDSLDAIDYEGSFVAAGTFEAANPGLEIDDLGKFGSPLSASEVKRIIGRSRQAGKGSETIVDTSVRNTWETDASLIKLRHPRWPSQERAILEHVCDQMGIAGGSEHVQAQLRKLFVYEEGAMFKPLQGTEKAPRMFGTLFVCLPSAHEGGDLVLSFSGQSQTHSFAKNSQWSCSYFSWYADVLYEVSQLSCRF